MNFLLKQGIIATVRPGSLAARLGLTAGDRLLSVNGQSPEDLIDLSFAVADSRFTLAVEKLDGTKETHQVRKGRHDDLGIEFESAVFDQVRCCANRCIFCFVDQMPAGMRQSLYVKDDDYRLSFLYGNFVTLTNLGPRDLDRIRRLHLSPLYVSVHATDGEVRASMLNNKRASQIMKQINELVSFGTELHAQIVLCPGINDGAVLEKSFRDLYALSPSVLSLAIVPVGLTRYRQDCHSLSGFTADGAAAVINQVENWQAACREETGESFVYLADEFYLAAGRTVPAYDLYADFPQLENGVGLVRCFLDEWEKTELTASYDQPLCIDVVCGVSAAKIIGPLLADWTVPNLTVRLLPVENKFFGPSITVTGLLTGSDILAALQASDKPGDGVIIPGIALRKGENIFLDDMTLEEFERQLGSPVRAAHFAADLKQCLADWR
ncbi:DUF512 domain-containing protein [Anaerosporomusa subterranea]|uniref:DUF512 domain-containing protein n=1 Tax=Anaerosporomusa subterranea TaxID=1794912 RepID=UPI0038B2FA3A